MEHTSKLMALRLCRKYNVTTTETFRSLRIAVEDAAETRAFTVQDYEDALWLEENNPEEPIAELLQ